MSKSTVSEAPKVAPVKTSATEEPGKGEVEVATLPEVEDGFVSNYPEVARDFVNGVDEPSTAKPLELAGAKRGPKGGHGGDDLSFPVIVPA